MDAEQARKITQNSFDAMDSVYTAIRQAAKRGHNSTEYRITSFSDNHKEAILTELAKKGFRVKKITRDDLREGTDTYVVINW